MAFSAYSTVQLPRAEPPVGGSFPQLQSVSQPALPQVSATPLSVAAQTASAPPPELAPTKERYSGDVVFYVNGQRHQPRGVQPETTLLQYLRAAGLTGTKLGCGEGGCGACTVMVSSVAERSPALRLSHRAVNACLAPVLSVEGMHVTTVEGLGTTRTGLNPVQERIAHGHGSQCGFCTPGIVMAMYAYLRAHPAASDLELEENMDGNLCRCTGYRPILDAARLARRDLVDKWAQGGGGGGDCGDGGGCGDCGQAGGCCQQQQQQPPAATGDAATTATATATATATTASAPCPAASEKRRQVVGALRSATTGELIFPPALLLRETAPLAVVGERVAWYRPLTLDGLLELKALHPAAKVVVGNTETGVDTKFRNQYYPVRITTTHVPELNQIQRIDDAGLAVGASVTLTALREALQRLVAGADGRPEEAARLWGVRAILDQLRWFAGNQIRNTASIGGNLANASPISDLNPVLLALGAQAEVASAAGGRRRVELRQPNFFAYRRIDIRPDEVLVSIFVPFTRPLEFVKAYKQARRRDDDIAIVTACIRVRFNAPAAGAADAAAYTVAEAAMGFGGMAPRTVAAPQTEAFLVGRPWTAETLEAAYGTLMADLPLAPNAPGGMVPYRRTLTLSFLFKFFAESSEQFLSAAAAATAGPSAYRVFHRPQSRGTQDYERGQDTERVHQPVLHQSAEKQVSGEAQYTDDIPAPPNCLHGALVLAKAAHARLVSLDASEALQMRGVVGFFGAADVPGSNWIGPVLHDEELFASAEVLFHSQPLGIVVAETQADALEAAKLVAAKLEPLPAILSIADAIEHQSFFDEKHAIERLGGWPEGGGGGAAAADAPASIDEALQRCAVQLEGELNIGGQEHFYLEPHGTLALPGEAADDMLVWSSTQAPTKTQVLVAEVLRVPHNRVVVKTKRIGGGFGGKETRSVFVSCAAAVAAQATRRPVRLILDRDVDMAISGGRHPFYARYRVGADASGRLLALDVELYNNAGYSLDLSGAVMDRALFHIDNAYRVPSVRVRGRLCRTHSATNTAFRGFGGPQAMLVCEHIVDHVARHLRLGGDALDAMRAANLYRENDRTHYGQLLTRCHFPRMWTELVQSAEVARRRREVAAFNDASRWRKRGLAVLPTKFGMSFTAKFMNQAGALVHIYVDGSVLITHGGIEMGQGLHTKMLQVAAQALDVPLDVVHLAETSTDKVPNTSPTAASVQSDINGMAILDACQQLRARLEPLRAAHPQLDWPQLVKKAHLERVDLSAHGFYRTPDVGYDFANVEHQRGGGRPFNYYCYGTACTEVEIDCLTGDVQLLRADLLMDVGASLNPALDIGQVEGAYVQGFGWTTMEEVVTLPGSGAIFTRGPGTYKIPGFNDIPIDLRVALLRNAPNDRAIYSSKGVGEPPFFLGATAFFAIKDACAAARLHAGLDGPFRLDSPATAERIRMACADHLTAKIEAAS